MECIIESNSESKCTWRRTAPSPANFVMYSFAIPVLAMFGCLANSLNAIVFMRPKMAPSAFTYLTALSWVDSLCCFIILLTCISRGYCLNSYPWIYFDMHLQSALFGSLTGAANWILAALAIDRIVYLCHRLPNIPPKFCSRYVARRIVCGIILISAVLNVPYYFIFQTRSDGSFYVTDFFYSKIYRIQNWFSFTMLCIIPGVFLLFGNIAVIVIFRRWVKKCRSACCLNKDQPATCSRQEHQLKLTITIVIVVFLYMIGELPAHITSRKLVVNVIFGGDVSKINFDRVANFECFFLTLNAFQLSFNIVVYAVINPAFMTEFFIFLRQMSDFVCGILGFSVLHRCWKKKVKKQMNVEETCEKHEASICYYNDVFVIDEDSHVNVENGINVVDRMSKSCSDLRFREDGLDYRRIIQRHSMSI